MDGNRFVTYTEDDRAIVRAGIEGVKAILLGSDAERKRSLLYVKKQTTKAKYGWWEKQIHDIISVHGIMRIYVL